MFVKGLLLFFYNFLGGIRMSLNFSAFEGKNIFKFAKYEVKEIGKTKYIVPDSINKKHSSGAPLILSLIHI